MSRRLCESCRRPVNVCWCHHFSWIENPIPIIILQHPTEKKHPFATLPILENMLRQCEIYVGEDFNTNQALRSQLAQLSESLYVVFPSSTATELDEKSSMHANESKPSALVFIDGTWNKAKKIWYSNPFLHTLPHLKLNTGNPSQYRVRKSNIPNSLSLVEACYYALELLDQSTDYSPLFTAFTAIIDEQERYIPKAKDSG